MTESALPVTGLALLTTGLAFPVTGLALPTGPVRDYRCGRPVALSAAVRPGSVGRRIASAAGFGD